MASDDADKSHMAQSIRLPGLLAIFFVLLAGGSGISGLLGKTDSAANSEWANSGAAFHVATAQLEPQSFDGRCKADGVLVCEGFDSPRDFVPATWPAQGLYPAWDKKIHGARDANIKASGESSLRFELLSNSGPNTVGFWRQPFEHNFGPGSTFYVQFRQRFSKEMLTNDWGDTAWKQVIFHNEGSTCAQVELTTVQYHHAGIPIMYTDCGDRALYWDTGQPPLLLQQGDFNCVFEHINQKDCFHYPAEEWVTFYYQVAIGHWGKPASTINAWVALDGKPYKRWIKMSHFILKNDHPGHDYDTLTLLTYMTNKDMKIVHPTAYTWYDELIVSKNPIAPPK